MANPKLRTPIGIRKRMAVAERRAKAVELYGQRLPYAEIAQRLNVPVGTIKSDIHLALKASQAKIADVAAKVRMRNSALLDAIIQKSAASYLSAEQPDPKLADTIIKAIDTQNRTFGLYLRDGGESNTLNINIINAEQYTHARHEVAVSQDEDGDQQLVIDGRVVSPKGLPEKAGVSDNSAASGYEEVVVEDENAENAVSDDSEDDADTITVLAQDAASALADLADEDNEDDDGVGEEDGAAAMDDLDGYLWRE